MTGIFLHGLLAAGTVAPPITTAPSTSLPSTTAATGQLPHVLLSALVLGPMLTALFLAFFPTRTQEDRGRIRLLAVIAVLILAIATLWMVNDVNSFGQTSAYAESHTWFSFLGIAVSYALSSNGVTTTLVFALDSIFFGLTFLRWKDRDYPRTNVTVMLMALGALNLLLFADDVVMLVAGFFLTLGAVGWRLSTGQMEASRRWTITGFMSIIVFSAVLLVLIRATGAGNALLLAPVLQPATFTAHVALLSGRGLLYLVAMGVLAMWMGVWPFHGWLGNVARHGDSLSREIVVGLVPRVAGYLAIVMTVGVFPAVSGQFSTLFAVLAVVNALWAAGGMAATKSLKRFVGYLSMAQGSVILFVIAVPTPLAITGAIYALVGSMLVTTGAVCAASFLEERWKDDPALQSMGVLHVMPRFGMVWMILVIAASGAPFFPFFTSDLTVFAGVIPGHRILACALLASFVLIAIALFRSIREILWGTEPHDRLLRAKDLGAGELGALGVIFVLILLYGIFPSHVDTLLNSGVTELVTHVTGG